MPRFSSREEYETWKAAQKGGSASAPATADAPAPAVAPPPRREAARGAPPRPTVTGSEREWIWIVRADTQRKVRVRLDAFGNETVLVDDAVVSSKRSFGMKSEHEVEVAPGFRGLVSVRTGLTGRIKVGLSVNGMPVMPASVPTRGFGAAALFPTTDTLPGARMAASQGVGAAVFMAVVTGLVGMLSGAGVRMAPFQLNPWMALLEATVFAGFAFGIHRMLRSVALVALAFYLYDRWLLLRLSLEKPQHAPGIGAMIVSFFILIAYVNGVRGSFAYRRLVEDDGPPVTFTLPRPREAIAVVAVFLVLGLSGAFFWRRAERRAAQEKACARGDAQACVAAAGYSSGATAAGFRERACKAGSVDSCLQLIGNPDSDCSGDKLQPCRSLAAAYARGGRAPEAERLLGSLCDHGDETSCEQQFDRTILACSGGNRSACAAVITSCRQGKLEACTRGWKSFSSSCASRRLFCAEQDEILGLGCQAGDNSLCIRLEAANMAACARGDSKACLAQRAAIAARCERTPGGCSRLLDLDARLCVQGQLLQCAELERHCLTSEPRACWSVTSVLAEPCAQGNAAACSVLRSYCPHEARARGYSGQNACIATYGPLRRSCQQGGALACDLLSTFCSSGIQSACQARRSGGAVSFVPR